MTLAVTLYIATSTGRSEAYRHHIHPLDEQYIFEILSTQWRRNDTIYEIYLEDGPMWMHTHRPRPASARNDDLDKAAKLHNMTNAAYLAYLLSLDTEI